MDLSDVATRMPGQGGHTRVKYEASELGIVKVLMKIGPEQIYSFCFQFIGTTIFAYYFAIFLCGLLLIMATLHKITT